MNKTGRRERKKIELRLALVDAAYELFEKQGFDETRIEDITNKVDVSTRTFFRYFASKEDVVLDYDAVEHEEIVTALARRAADEPIITALRHAAVEVTKGCEEGFYGVDGDRFRTLRSLIRTHPLIRARSLEQAKNRKDALVSVIAKRLNVEADEDLRPKVVAEVLEFASSAAYDAWKNYPAQTIAYSEVLDQVFELLEGGINFG
ncbi:TetR family transcriptional regulator [Agrobacterium tumefaciens]|uniref:TetR family transcriptional regulator n=1 Tax=Agrobacterium tumefaciens TaxID=358 RepID=UPI0021D1CEF0|nr:TetR family transcriptional regulator [Agrobacterium tumefaciens]UXS02966.1 TetR family transcriptional regulator [Agrobacterium tumefaciens]